MDRFPIAAYAATLQPAALSQFVHFVRYANLNDVWRFLERATGRPVGR